MSRTGENIYKRKDGRWEARYIKSYEGNGKAQYGYLYAKTYAEVKSKLIQAVSLASTHPSVVPTQDSRGTYGDWLDDWLAFRKPRVKESTYIRYRNTIHNHIHPYLGKYPVSKIGTSLMESFVSHLLNAGRIDKKGGLSPKSIADIITIIKETFQYINSNGVNTVCCFEYLTVKREPKEMRVLTKREEQALIAVLLEETDLYKLGVFLCLHTGIRIGELCALQWKDISLTEKTLRVSQTMQRVQKVAPNEVAKTHIILTDPKSHAAKCIIPLPDFVVRVLADFESLPNTYILTGSRSEYVEPRTMQNRFKGYLRQCGVEDANFHALRHTFATRCVEFGFDIKSLSEILGHSSVKITLDKYVHSSLEQKRTNMEKLPSCF